MRDLRHALRDLNVLNDDDRIAVVDLLQKALCQSPKLRLAKTLNLIAGEYEQQHVCRTWVRDLRKSKRYSHSEHRGLMDETSISTGEHLIGCNEGQNIKRSNQMLALKNAANLLATGVT